MKIVYKDNPLETEVHLDDHDKSLLWHKIMIEELEELLFDVHYSLTERDDAEKAVEVSDPDYYMVDSGKSGLEKRVDNLTGWYVENLLQEHCGDCTCVPASCSKCNAEYLLGISTIKGLYKHQANFVGTAFENSSSIGEAIEYLENYNPHADWEGWEAHADRWKQEAAEALAWLEVYRQEHLRRS